MENKSEIRMAGWVILATAAANVALMVNHPTGHDTGGVAETVHGMLQFIILMQFAALLVVMRGFGFSFAMTITALFLGVGQLSALLAATVNGFAVPAMHTYSEASIGRDVAIFAWEMNQAFAQLGVVAVGIAFVALSCVLWSRGSRLVAILGCAAGLVPTALLISGTITMNLQGALVAYLTQAAFLALLGFLVGRGKLLEELA